MKKSSGSMASVRFNGFFLVSMICVFIQTAHAETENWPNVFAAKGISKNAIMYREGKIEKIPGGDEVTYSVDRPNKKVIRTAVFNAGIKQGVGAGLQSDNTIYSIVYDQYEPLTSKHIIKAIGQAGMRDGFDTIVIDDKNITTSISKFDYFILYFYNRTDLASGNS